MTNPLAQDLGGVVRLLEKATPGPWHYSEKGFSTKPTPMVYATGQDLNYIAMCRDFGNEGPTLNEENAQAIAAAINFLRANSDEIAVALRDAERWRKLVALPVVVECEELGWKYWHDEPRCKSLAERVDASSSPHSPDKPVRSETLWRSVCERPEPMTCDETGCTTGLALVIHDPQDGGPNIRQGSFDHCLRGFFDSATAQRIEPDLWAFAPIKAAMQQGGGGGE